jgi:photosystem II stability/assembly factor-like uncharacterized protein
MLPGNSLLRRAVVTTSVAALVAGGLATSNGTASAAPTSPAVTPAQLQGALSWKNVGPLVGGRSLSVSGSSARPNEYYFGATGGGVWKTTDAGETWNPVSDGQMSASSVGAIAVCQANPDIVYAGTGEVDVRTDTIQGDGMYKTVDGGKTWTHIGLTDSQIIAKIAVDPNDCNHAYVSAQGHLYGPNDQRGVFTTTNGGASWNKSLFVDDTTGSSDVSLDPTNPQVVYASMWHMSRSPFNLSSGGPGDGLFKSTDGGAHWTNLSTNPGFPAAPLGRIGVSVSPLNPNRVWAIVEAKVGQGGAEMVSDDAGATWRITSTSSTLSQRPFYFFHIIADPADVNGVYVTSLSLVHSSDTGKTFTQVRGTPHSDHHDLWINPKDPQRMINANDGGGTVSVDGGRTWTDEDYSTGQMYHAAITNDVPYLICGTQQDENGGACVPVNGDGSQSIAPGGGEGGQMAVDPSHPQLSDGGIIYAGQRRGTINLFQFNAAFGLRNNRQVRSIGVWPEDPTGHPASEQKEREEWEAPVVTSPADPHAIYTASQHVFRSIDGGHSWQQLSPDLSRNDPATQGDSGGPINPDQSTGEDFGTVYTVAPSLVNRNVIWAGSDDGLVHVTRNLGKSWTDVTPAGLPHFIRMSHIDASPFAPGTAYLSADNERSDDTQPYLFKTTDYGQHWTKITNGIAAGAFPWVIHQDPVNADLLYAGTNNGIYFSLDNGANWQSLQLGLPDTSVHDITTHGDDLIISTYGRGYYVLHGLSLLRQVTSSVMAEPTHLFAPAPQQLGQDNGLKVDYNLSTTVSQATLQFVSTNGQVLDSVAVSGQRGLHSFTWTQPKQAEKVTVQLITPAGTQEQRATVLADPGKAVSFAPAPPAPAPKPDKDHSVSNDVATLFRPTDPTRSVDTAATVFYQLDKGASSVSMTVLDSKGNVVRTFTGLPTSAGTNSSTWNLTYPGAISTSGSVGNGPKAPLGDYTVQLTVDSFAPLSQSFTILKDPRLTGVNAPDILQQFQFGEKVVAATTAANQAIRYNTTCISQIDAAVAAAGNSQVTSAGQALEKQIQQIQDALVQANTQEDKFPVRLGSQISGLLRIAESADGQPTVSSQQVFDVLNARLATQLTNLSDINSTQVPQFNNLLQQQGLAPVCQSS